MSPEIEQRIRILWEETPQSAKQIGALFGVSRGVITGMAWRRDWWSFNPGSGGKGYRPPRTLHDRLDALNAKMDRILAETEPAIRNRAREAA